MTKKISLVIILLLLVGVSLVPILNYWEERVLSSNISKIKTNDSLVSFLEKILPEESVGKIKIQNNKNTNILAATFQMESNRNPRKIISEYLFWSKKAIEQNKLDIKSIRIFVYFNKEKKQYYAIVGKNKFYKITKELDKLNDCERKKPLDFENFCTKSNNF